MPENKYVAGQGKTASKGANNMAHEMKSETATIITVVTIALAAFAFYVYAFTKDGVPGYGLWMVAGFITLITILTLRCVLPNAEEKRFQKLVQAETSQTALATITALRRGGSLETSSRRFIYLALTVQMPMQTQAQPLTATFKAKIEENLLPGFATGKQVFLIYDPQDPANVAIDRRKNPVSVE